MRVPLIGPIYQLDPPQPNASMSNEFQLQLIRKTLEDLGHAPVADLLASRIGNSNSASQRGLGLEIWGKSVAGDNTNQYGLSFSSSLKEHLNQGDYDLAVQMFESCQDEFHFANSRVQLTDSQKLLCVYLIHRFAFLEKVVLRSFGHPGATSTHELVSFLKNDLTAAYNAVDIDFSSSSNGLPTRITTQLSRDREANLLMSLAMLTTPIDKIEERIFDHAVVLTDPNGSKFVVPLELSPFLNRLRTVLSQNILDVLLSGKKGDLTPSSWTYHDIPANCLESLIRSAVLHNLLTSLYYLPPRTEPYLEKNLPVSMLLSSSHAEVTKDDLPIHLLHTLADHSDEVWFTKFSPLGRYLATGSLDGTCNIYDVHNNFTLLAELDANAEDQESVFVTGSHKPALDKRKGIIYFSWEPYERYIVTCCLDTVLRVWDVEKITQNQSALGTIEDERPATLLCCFTLGESMRTWSCEFLPYDRNTKPHFIVGSPDKVLKAFTIDGQEVLNFYSDAEEWLDILDEEGSLQSILHPLSRSGSHIRSDPITSPTARNDSKDEKNNSTLQQFKRVNDFAITANGKVLITANNDKQVFFYKIPDLFDPSATTSRIALLSLYGTLTSCTVSADSRYMLLSIAPEELQLWDISPLEKLQKPFLKQKFVGQSQATYIVRSCFGYLNMPQNKEELVLSGSDDGHIYIWKLETGQLITRIRGHHGLCNSVDWNRFYKPVGHGIDYGMLWSSAGDDKLVKIWGPRAS